MNRALRRRKEREDAHAQIKVLEEQVRGLAQAKAHLLDLLNVIIMGAGGRVEVPFGKVQDQRGHPVHVDTLPPDPERPGAEGRVVLTLEGWRPPTDAAERMREHGLWLPGQEL